MSSSKTVTSSSSGGRGRIIKEARFNNLWSPNFAKTQLTDNQFVNCKLSKLGKPVGEERITRQSCYQDINRICKELKIDSITEKMCKSLGTRYTHYFPLYKYTYYCYRRLVDSEEFSPEAISEIGLWKSTDSHRNYYKISTTIRRKSSNVIVAIE